MLLLPAAMERCRSESAGSLLGLQRNSSTTPAAAAGGSNTPRTPLSGSRNSPAAQSQALLPTVGPISRKTSGSFTSSMSSRPSLAHVPAGSLNPAVAVQHSLQQPVTAATVSTLVDVLWRPLLAGLSGVLSRCTDNNRHEALMLQVSLHVLCSALQHADVV